MVGEAIAPIFFFFFIIINRLRSFLKWNHLVFIVNAILLKNMHIAYVCLSYCHFYNLSIGNLESSSILQNNDTYLGILSNWLKPVVQSKWSYWKRCWRASVDGWAASTFHSGCDNKGPTVTIIKVGQYIFGGYTSDSWGK